MSLSETDTQTGETVAEQLALLREDHAELRGLVLALHEELCYVRGRWPALEVQVAEMHGTLTTFRPLLDKYAAAAGSPAARWARGRGRGADVPGAHQCQGYRHDGPRGECFRTDSHRWSQELGCHSVGPVCRD